MENSFFNDLEYFVQQLPQDEKDKFQKIGNYLYSDLEYYQQTDYDYLPIISHDNNN